MALRYKGARSVRDGGTEAKVSAVLKVAREAGAGLVIQEQALKRKGITDPRRVNDRCEGRRGKRGVYLDPTGLDHGYNDLCWGQ